MSSVETSEKRAPVKAAENVALDLRDAVSISPVIYYVATAGKSPELQSISPNAAKILGIEPKGPPDRLVSRIHHDDLTAYQKKIKALQETGPQIVEIRLRNSDDDDVWFRDYLTLSDTSKGNPVTFMGCLIDVSAEVALRQRYESTSNAYQDLTQDYNDAIDSLVSGFCLTDNEDVIIAINTALADVTGHVQEHFIGHPRRRLIEAVISQMVIFEGETVEQTDAWVDKITRTMAGATGKSVEVKMATGEWILITLDPISQGGQSAVSTDISMQKKVEDELRDSEIYFRTLVENHPLPAILVDFETGQVVYESPAASKLFGREANSEVPFFVQELYANPSERPNFIAALKAQGELSDYPIHYRRRDGSTYWISSNSKLIKYDGRDFHITSIMDLTEQREREGALKRAHETLEDAIESLTEGFALFDSDGRLITFNSRYLAFNDTCQDLLKPGLSFEELIRTAYARGEFHADESQINNFLTRHHDIDGNRQAVHGVEFQQRQNGRWLLYSNQLTRQNGFVLTLNDISENKAMEQALRDSEAAVRVILEASPTPITVSRLEDNRVLYESPVSRDLFMRSAAQTDFDVFKFWVNPEDRLQIWSDLRADGVVGDREVLLRKSDGSEFWAAYSGRLVNHQGTDLVVSTVHDLTENKALQVEMVRQRESLHVSEKMVAMGELLASVSHELNNPLSVVVGQTQLLQETAEDPAIAKRAERISTAADRCARIVKTFLAMARQQPRDREATDPNKLIDLALELTNYSLRGSNVEVLLSKSQSLPLVLVDADQITQVLTNLIVNAEHALRETDGERQMKIISRFASTSNEVIIKVKDNGPGIPSEIRRRIFEPLFTTKEMGEGTGIGLALCHRLLEANGGKIKLASGIGIGASFTVRLPVDVENADAADRVEALPSARESLSILVVDDEPFVSELLMEILELDGHSVINADNGQVALEYLEKQDFDVVLSDVRMPGFDGPWLFRQLSANKPEILERIAFITGDTLSHDIAAFLRDSKRPYIEKPITPNDVRSLLETVSRLQAETIETIKPDL